MSRRLGAILSVVAVALVGAVVTACAGTPGTGGGGTGSAPSPVASSSPGASGGGVNGPRNGLKAASLQLSAGAGEITVQTSALGSDLYDVVSEGGTAPKVTFDSPTVDVRMPNGSHEGLRRLTVTLNQDVRWSLRLNGGSTREVVNVRSGQVDSVAMAAGANDMELVLGAPRGQVPVRFTGGANRISLRIPNGASASLRIRGAANSITVDGESRGKVAGGGAFQVGADQANRYSFDVLAGLNTLSLDQS